MATDETSRVVLLSSYNLLSTVVDALLVSGKYDCSAAVIGQDEMNIICMSGVQPSLLFTNVTLSFKSYHNSLIQSMFGTSGLILVSAIR